MHTFTIMVHIANVYILFLPDFTIWLFELLLTNHRSWNWLTLIPVLRLIGLTWDLYDGTRLKKNPESLSKDQLKTALSSSPNILEMLSHSFFIGGYFVGPQFSLAKYREFVSPEYQSSLPSSPVPFGLKRLGISICYLTAHVVGMHHLK